MLRPAGLFDQMEAHLFIQFQCDRQIGMGFKVQLSITGRFCPFLRQMQPFFSVPLALHGIRQIDKHGDYAEVTTHCGQTFRIYNSRNSRAARWLRNKWAVKPCPKCKVPDWKLEKYSKTFFDSHYGSDLTHKK